MTVSRETPLGLATRYALPERAADQITALLAALGREAAPPTTVRDPQRALAVHVADSLSGLEVEALRQAARIADIGAGAGFPGLALAIALPGATVDLVESARRKCELIERLARAADLTNAHAVRARAEELARGPARASYAAVTARALAALPVVAEYAAPLLAPGGALVAWKGSRDSGEEARAARAAELVGLAPADVLSVRPYEGIRDHHLHVYLKVRDTPERFPRRPGMARKRPLG